jgi:hypothetical protein
MQGKRPPGDGDVKIDFELFNTPGTEVAPRSDVVGEDFQYRFFQWVVAFLSGLSQKKSVNTFCQYIRFVFRVIFCVLVSSDAPKTVAAWEPVSIF